jgi:hypothetical protein
MIKNFIPQPFQGDNPLPDYVSNISRYELTGNVVGDYEITLAKLTVGNSLSAGNPLAHALFESFTDHGKRAMLARTRVSGCDMEFMAIKSAMSKTGVEFYPAMPCSCKTILEELGKWFMAHNTEIIRVSVVSQTCH